MRRLTVTFRPAVVIPAKSLPSRKRGRGPSCGLGPRLRGDDDRDCGPDGRWMCRMAIG